MIRDIRSPKYSGCLKKGELFLGQEMRGQISEGVGCEWCVQRIVSLGQKEEVMGTAAKAGELVRAKLDFMFEKYQGD